MRYGIIGCGRIHRNHAMAARLLPGVELVGIADPDEARRQAAAAEWGVPGYRDHVELAAAGVDAVAVCLPHNMHADVCVQMAEAGIHVLCEKPISTNVADADRMIAACDRNDVRLGVVFQHRFNENSRILHELIHSGAFGRLTLGTARFQYFKSPADSAYFAWRGNFAEAGGGVLANFGIHTVDQLCWLMGPAASASGHVANLVMDIEVEDTGVVALRFANGALGTIAATLASPLEFESEITITGTKASAVLRDSTSLEVSWSGGRRDSHRFLGQFDDPAFPTKPPYGRGHIGVVADFAEAIARGRPPLVDGVSARQTLALVVEAYDSARAGSVA